MQNNLHSRLSPSSAYRWLSCPGSLDSDGIVLEASVYAAEGTVAHGLAEKCFVLGERAEKFLGEKVEQEGFTITIDEEMVDAVQMYCDFLDMFRAGTPALLEKRIEHSSIPDFGGTIDAVLPYQHHIVDFKYGAGNPVEVEGDAYGTWFGQNAQLACYALLYSAEFNIREEIKATIIQPRAHHADGPIRTTVFTPEYLDHFAGDVRMVAERAGQLLAGDHCKWCPRATGCPELYRLTLSTASREFLPDNAPEHGGMTAAKAAEVLALRAPIQEFFKQVEEYAQRQLESGAEVPGFKLVERLGNRRWAHAEDEIAKRLKKFGKKNIFKTELLSPTQMEKVVGKEVVSDLVERPNLGTALVPNSDRRAAVKRITAAAEEFINERISNE